MLFSWPDGLRPGSIRVRVYNQARFIGPPQANGGLPFYVGDSEGAKIATTIYPSPEARFR